MYFWEFLVLFVLVYFVFFAVFVTPTVKELEIVYVLVLVIVAHLVIWEGHKFQREVEKEIGLEQNL